ncbi:MAG: hypothetical protein QF593_02335, partial [Nitrospinota bacterium]|nr:hypothetical protein [Nitrospinota bacterium]
EGLTLLAKLYHDLKTPDKFISQLEDKNFKALFPGGRGVEIQTGGGKKDQNGEIRSFQQHKWPYRTPQGETIPVFPQVRAGRLSPGIPVL